MEKAYEPKQHEARIYKMWEDSGAFKPDKSSKKPPFSIIMPPPNANGNLHTGHGMYTVDDIMTRYRRMQGHPTLWLPGTDHAGIETQVVFERELEKEGKSRSDFTPQSFYDAALKFVLTNEGRMLDQMRSMGFSADWSRKKFTLDPDIIEIVYDTFKQLLEDGHIYRGNRIVNWCPHCNSSFADIEIKYREQLDPLYYLKYGPFVLATVRPETKFGDTAVAVHPDDGRYQKYIGKEIEAEGLLGPFKLKVIADEYVNPEFGTGVVKVTPAHDPNDWEMGQRHHLEVKQAIGTDGRLTELAGKYAGMSVLDARQQIVQDLQEKGLIDHIDMDYKHNVAYHGRCGTQIEPLVTEQWWLRVAELTKPAIAAIEKNEVEFYPARFKKQALDWLKNLRDWNISRQNWFGIRIPIYYNANPGNGKDDYRVFSHENEAKSYYGENGYEAETDTFDTWFSSGQWPFATLMATGDFDEFYPTSVMGTMRDILYLWVTRMIMFGLYRTGKVPFKTVYLWGAVNDAQGQKMSKSKGNVINPLDMTAKYGTDALRLALTIGVTPGTGGSISEPKIAGYRNFCNKLWNVARFVLGQVPEGYSPTDPAPKTLADSWILDRVSRENAAITEAIEGYRFSEAGERIYSLLWDDFADWYLEASKEDPNTDVLVYCLETILKLAHPFAPYVTEAIWQNLAWQKDNLIVTSWPRPEPKFTKHIGAFEDLRNLVVATRSVNADLGLAKPKLLHLGSSLIEENAAIVTRLANLGGIEKVGESRGLRLAGSFDDAWLDVSPSEIDAYLAKLERKRSEAGEYAKRLKAQLANKRYLESAPADLVEQTRVRLAETELLLSQLDEQIATIKK